MIESYPLCWPEGYARTKPGVREPSRFETNRQSKLDVHDMKIELEHEVALLNGRRYARSNDVIVSTNMPVRKDGNLYKSAREPDDPGVAVYFMYKDRQYVLPCDYFKTVRENLRAILIAISNIRQNFRYHISGMEERIFSGFTALTDDAGKSKEWYHVLGVSPDASQEEIKAAYRKKLKQVHPDTGGSEDLTEEVIHAYNSGMLQYA